MGHRGLFFVWDVGPPLIPHVRPAARQLVVGVLGRVLCARVHTGRRRLFEGGMFRS